MKLLKSGVVPPIVYIPFSEVEITRCAVSLLKLTSVTPLGICVYTFNRLKPCGIVTVNAILAVSHGINTPDQLTVCGVALLKLYLI